MKSRVADYGSKTEKYEWDQSEDAVSICFNVAEGLRGKDLAITITKTTLSASVKGEEPIIKGKLFGEIIESESNWTKDETAIEITLEKKIKSKEDDEWWPYVVEEDKNKKGGSIDVGLIGASKYLDDSLLKKVKEAKKAKEAKEEAAIES